MYVGAYLYYIWLASLSSLVALVKSHIRNYLDGIFELIHQYWGDVSLLPQVKFQTNQSFQCQSCESTQELVKFQVKSKIILVSMHSKCASKHSVDHQQYVASIFQELYILQ